MFELRRLSHIFKSSEQIPFDDSSRFVFMSDCHRGDGSWGDNFANNRNLYSFAISQYYKNNFTYIELGDGDELWENKKFYDIEHEHHDVFQILVKFLEERRLYMIFGNHDMAKKSGSYVKKNLYQYFDELEKETIPLFYNIKIHEGLVLSHRYANRKIFLIHGHQVDCLNNQWWRLSKLLVRFVWRPLELFGIKDPTRTAKNFWKKESVDNRLVQWVKKEKHMLIAGHTHRPVFPDAGEAPYFNDGSCVHPHSISAIEIADGKIMLVKWGFTTKGDGTLSVERKLLAGPTRLIEYFEDSQINAYTNE